MAETGPTPPPARAANEEAGGGVGVAELQPATTGTIMTPSSSVTAASDAPSTPTTTSSAEALLPPPSSSLAAVVDRLFRGTACLGAYHLCAVYICQHLIPTQRPPTPLHASHSAHGPRGDAALPAAVPGLRGGRGVGRGDHRPQDAGLRAAGQRCASLSPNTHTCRPASSPSLTSPQSFHRAPRYRGLR